MPLNNASGTQAHAKLTRFCSSQSTWADPARQALLHPAPAAAPLLPPLQGVRGRRPAGVVENISCAVISVRGECNMHI